MKVTRRNAREWAVQMLTAADLNPPEDIGSFIADFWAQLNSLDDEDQGGPCSAHGGMKAFAEQCVAGVLGAVDELDAVLERHLENWDLFRLGTVERVVLRLGAWELLHSDVPRPVVINEAVDLVNWFSSPLSRTLVNGVLDRLAKELPPQAEA